MNVGLDDPEGPFQLRDSMILSPGPQPSPCHSQATTGLMESESSSLVYWSWVRLSSSLTQHSALLGADLLLLGI